jgi:hypothetical protein
LKALYQGFVSKQKLTVASFIAEKSILCKGKARLIKVEIAVLLQCTAYFENIVSKLFFFKSKMLIDTAIYHLKKHTI